MLCVTGERANSQEMALKVYDALCKSSRLVVLQDIVCVGKIQAVVKQWRDWRKGSSTNASIQRKQNGSSSHSIDVVDSSTTTPTTHAPTVSHTAHVPYLETRTSYPVEDALFKSPNLARKTSNGLSSITVRRDERFICLQSRELSGESILKLEVIPLQHAFQKDSWRTETLRAQIYLEADSVLAMMLGDMKEEILEKMMEQKDLPKRTG